MAMDKTSSMLLSKRMLWRAFAAASLLAMAGCDHLHQDMGNQPKNLPLSPSGFFADGRSERAPVENTVPRDAMVNDDLIVAKDSNNFPLPVNQALLERGEERYKIFCAPCHGLQGDGNGMVAMRGMKHPTSYHLERLRQEPNGYYYDVQWLLLRRDYQWIWADVQLLRANSAARSLGHHFLCARAAA
jgi:hypothetical protein